MKNKINIFIIFAMIVAIGCGDDLAETNSDELLLKKSNDSSSHVWYKKTNLLLNKSVESGHTQPYLRVRYNTVAATQLDAENKVKEGAVFPEGSLIVKELWDASKKLTLLAIMYKDHTNKDSDAEGWVWTYIEPNGTVKSPASGKGSGCVSCHHTPGSIDGTLMNKYLP